jgi:hypothetical protein
MKWFTSIVLGCLVLGCASTPALSDHGAAEPTTLRGMVYDLDRIPVTGAKVVVSAGLSRLESTTDIHGRFAIPEVTLGSVVLTFTKSGYETFEWPLLFTESSQVVYVQMANGDQLYEAAVDALDRKEWQDARRFLDRADKLQPPGPTAVFLRACLESGLGNDRWAAESLEGYFGPRDPVLAVELFLGDLYERRLDQPAQALTHLKRVLQLKDDPEVATRVTQLEARL